LRILFSLKSAYPLVQSFTGSELVKYIPDSQNLLCENDNSRRYKLLYRGNTDIIACLSTLARTRHVGHSFVVDLIAFTPQLIMMSVNGLFWEQGPTGNQALRSFNRELVIVPHGRGYCVMNEELFVTNATDDQSKVALRTSTPVSMLPPTPTPTPVPAEVSPQVAYIDDAMKQQMVEGLAAQTGMNMYWTKNASMSATGIFNKPYMPSVN
jgi:nuclear RNA export factor